jgi:hypothetical protein
MVVGSSFSAKHQAKKKRRRSNAHAGESLPGSSATCQFAARFAMEEPYRTSFSETEQLTKFDFANGAASRQIPGRKA